MRSWTNTHAPGAAARPDRVPETAGSWKWCSEFVHDHRVERAELGEVGVGQDPVRERDLRVEPFAPRPAARRARASAATLRARRSSASGYARAKRTVMSAGPHARSSMRPRGKSGNASPKRVTAAWCDSAKFASEYASAWSSSTISSGSVTRSISGRARSS